MVVDPAELEERADRRFRALADQTRRDIVRRTLSAEYSVSALARLYPMSFAAVQKHVAVLAEAGLVTKRANGREQLVRADVHAVGQVRALLQSYEEIWRDRMGRFDAVLTDVLGVTDPG